VRSVEINSLLHFVNDILVLSCFLIIFGFVNGVGFEASIEVC
jgi:hypothetical protein